MKSFRLPLAVAALKNFLDLFLFFFLPIYLKSNGLAGWQIGILYAISLVVGILITFPSGVTNDRHQARHLITFALLLSVIYYFGLNLSTNFYFLCLMYFFFGLSMRVFDVSMNSLVYKIIQPKKGAVNLGQFVSVKTLCAAFGVVLGGFSLQLFDFQNVLIFAGSFALLLALLSLLLPSNEIYKFEVAQYRKDIFKQEVLFFVFIMFLFTLHYGAEQTSYGLFLSENLGLAKPQMGLYMGLGILGLAASALYFGHLTQSKKISASQTLTIGFLLSGLGHVLMTYPNFYSSLTFRFIHELGDGATIFFMHYGVFKLFPRKRIGGNASILVFISALGGFSGSLITGVLGENYGYHWPLIFSGASILLSLCLVLYYRKQIRI